MIFNYTVATTLTVASNITINDSNIAWDSDVKYKFKNAYSGLASGTTWEEI